MAESLDISSTTTRTAASLVGTGSIATSKNVSQNAEKEKTPEIDTLSTNGEYAAGSQTSGYDSMDLSPSASTSGDEGDRKVEEPASKTQQDATKNFVPIRKKKHPIFFKQAEVEIITITTPKNHDDEKGNSSASEVEYSNMPLKQRLRMKIKNRIKKKTHIVRLKESRADKAILQEMENPKPSTSGPIRREFERFKKLRLKAEEARNKEIENGESPLIFPASVKKVTRNSVSSSNMKDNGIKHLPIVPKKNTFKKKLPTQRVQKTQINHSNFNKIAAVRCNPNLKSQQKQKELKAKNRKKQDDSDDSIEVVDISSDDAAGADAHSLPLPLPVTCRNQFDEEIETQTNKQGNLNLKTDEEFHVDGDKRNVQIPITEMPTQPVGYKLTESVSIEIVQANLSKSYSYIDMTWEKNPYKDEIPDHGSENKVEINLEEKVSSNMGKDGVGICKKQNHAVFSKKIETTSVIPQKKNDEDETSLLSKTKLTNMYLKKRLYNLDTKSARVEKINNTDVVSPCCISNNTGDQGNDITIIDPTKGFVTIDNEATHSRHSDSHKSTSLRIQTDAELGHKRPTTNMPNTSKEIQALEKRPKLTIKLHRLESEIEMGKITIPIKQGLIPLPPSTSSRSQQNQSSRKRKSLYSPVENSKTHLKFEIPQDHQEGGKIKQLSAAPAISNGKRMKTKNQSQHVLSVTLKSTKEKVHISNSMKMSPEASENTSFVDSSPDTRRSQRKRKLRVDGDWIY